MNEEIKLTVGLPIRFDGDCCIVSVVSENSARVIRPNGLIELVPNPFRSYFLEEVREGVNELELILALHPDKREELTKPITDEENEIMKTPAKKSEAYKNKPRGGLAAQKAAAEAAAPKPAKAPRAPKAPKAPKLQKETRSSYTRALAHIAHNSAEEIHKLAKAKYPTSDMSTTKRLVEDERAKIAKA